MSRAPPFPTRSPSRARPSSPSQTTGETASTSGTWPLQISQPEPASNNRFISNSSFSPYTNASATGPLRPQRSELRSRVSDHDPLESTSHRDSISTTQSDASISRNTSTPPKPWPQRMQSPISEDEVQSTPVALNSVLSAFRTAGARRRAMTDASDGADQMERQNEVEAEMARQQRIRDRVPGRRTNGGPVGDVDAILDQVKDGWEFIIDPEFNNVDLALQLLSEAGPGKDVESFRKTKEMLGSALKGSVDKHYQAFAASLPHRTTFLNHLTEMQSQIQAARTALLDSKDSLGNKRADLVQLWSRGQTLDEMLRILDEIEYLRSVPDLLETLMSEKRLLQASVLLVRSLKIMNKPDMLEVGALSDLRSYLNAQETGLRDILLDELHSHLYLKSFWCDSRWAAYAPGQQTLPKVEFEDEAALKPSNSMESSPTSFHPTRQERFLSELTMKPNEPPIDLNDLNTRSNGSPPSSGMTATQSAAPQNPEADSFSFLETLIESLAVLGTLGTVLDNVAQRLPTEIFSLVESTIAEVEERAEYGRNGNTLALSRKSEGVYTFVPEGSGVDPHKSHRRIATKVSSLRLTALESSWKTIDHEILRDLFWTLYSKLDAVAQGLRIIYEVANRVGSRREFKDSSGAKPGSLFSLAEVWAPVQSEVRTLIHDYLVDEGQGAGSGRNPISSINEILREGKFIRDKNKTLFRFVDTDMRTAGKALKPHEDGVTRILNETMPGLVPGSSGDAVQAALPSIGVDDRMLGVDQHHRLITRPDPFHVSILFQPTLTFFSRIAQVLPLGLTDEGNPNSILNEFVLKVYLPQLEEKVSDLFHQAVTGHEAFQPDALSSLSPKPLAKASVHLMALVNSLCAMLRTSPFHRENYSKLILGVIVQFYQRCSDKFRDLVSPLDATGANLGSTLPLAAEWAQRSELSACLSELLSTYNVDTAKQHNLCRQETNLELELLAGRTIEQADLVPSIRQLSSLATLYHSLTWFAAGLDALSIRPDDTPSEGIPVNLEPLSAATSFEPTTPVCRLPLDDSKLPLSREMSLRFQALIRTYEQLSCMILTTIRIDIRCRTIFRLHSFITQGNFSADSDASKPDPHIANLNAELMKYDDVISISLPKREQQFVFMDLGNLMEHTLILNARQLCLPTSSGIRKIMRNILSLQQIIKSLAQDGQSTEFDRAKTYYSLFFTTPQDMLNGIREGNHIGFTFDEYQTMLNIQCGVNPAEGEMGATKATDRNYGMYMIELHGLELENSDS